MTGFTVSCPAYAGRFSISRRGSLVERRGIPHKVGRCFWYGGILRKEPCRCGYLDGAHRACPAAPFGSGDPMWIVLCDDGSNFCCRHKNYNRRQRDRIAVRRPLLARPRARSHNEDRGGLTPPMNLLELFNDLQVRFCGGILTIPGKNSFKAESRGVKALHLDKGYA